MKRNLLLLATGLFMFSMVGMAEAAPVQWGSADGGNNHWYDVISDVTTWEAASTAAQTMTHDGMQGHLATLTSIEEDTFVSDEFNFSSPDPNDPDPVNLWLGGYQIGEPNPSGEPSGNWAWVTGETWFFANWLSNEPNDDSGNEDHLTYYNYYGWNDRHGGDTQQGYIVEYEPAAAIPTLNEWGLIGLSLLLVGISHSIIRNRKSDFV
ncbi:MAG: IPTL-CTERM sorting domain-containing protein [Pseudomonadota bacterium]|nr:IPTL-CTERM sorting domain-containing protein [Pseudomonadota bacterium]